MAEVLSTVGKNLTGISGGRKATKSHRDSTIHPKEQELIPRQETSFVQVYPLLSEERKAVTPHPLLPRDERAELF